MNKSEAEIIEVILDNIRVKYRGPFPPSVSSKAIADRKDLEFKSMYLTFYPPEEGEFDCKKCHGTGRIGYREIDEGTGKKDRKGRPIKKHIRVPCKCTFHLVDVDKIMEDYETYKRTSISEEVEEGTK